MSRITNRGATGPLAIQANGQFQQSSQSVPLYGSSVTDAELSTLLGSRWDLQDGREVRLVLAGAVNLAQGKLMAAPATVAGNQGLAVTAFTAYSNNGNQPAVVTLTNGATAITANQYANGFLVVTSGTGLGQTLQIAGHAAITNGVSGTITLADGPNVALDATSVVGLFQNPCANVIINNHSALQQPVGVTLYPITAANYGFIVSRGLTACLNSGGTTVGSSVSPSNDVDGAVENGQLAQGFVGIAAIAGTDTQYQPISVNL